MKPPDALADQLEIIAKSLADAIVSDEKLNRDQVTAFKALSAYFISTRKLGKSDADDGPGGFMAAKGAIAQASRGGNGANHE